MQNTEIEHKFLVTSDAYRSLATAHHVIRQGYISASPGRTVRIRRSDDKAYLTIKGPAPAGSLARFEWEREITLDDFDALFPLTLSSVEKVRYIVPLPTIGKDGQELMLKVEIDEFHGLNEGLVMAEIELPTEDTPFSVPAFLGEDVTGDRRYYNTYLSEHPFLTWEKE